MKYKNIVFDFGNVIGKFDGNYILEQFCSSQEDMELLIPVLYRNWISTPVQLIMKKISKQRQRWFPRGCRQLSGTFSEDGRSMSDPSRRRMN